ncbi:MAG: hypothetical protein VKO01_00235 [Cyanobacteriota bacterium]|nr:hypothetical protein [Cyanobacteriota bacterium]
MGLIPALTHNLSLTAQTIRDGATTLIEPGAGLITQARTVSENPYSFGFALEHLQALGFNLNAALQGADSRAYQIPVDGTRFGPDIYIDKAGQVIATFQVKGGSSNYEVGPRLLTSGIVTVMVLLFPPMGMAMLTASVLLAIWAELAPEWVMVLHRVVEKTLVTGAAGVTAATRELGRAPFNWLGSSAASGHASSTHLAEMDGLLDALFYGHSHW